MLAGGNVVELRMLHASSGSNHCFLEFAQEGAARRALDCSGALLGIFHTPFPWVVCTLYMLLLLPYDSTELERCTQRTFH